MDLVEARRWPILNGIGDADLKAILPQLRRRRFARREVLFHEGDPGRALHLVVKGHVGVRMSTELGDVVTVGLVGPGEVLGEMALVSESDIRMATAIALDVTETLSLDRDAVVELRAHHPGIDRAMVQLLSHRLTQVSGQLLEALYVPVDKRLLRCLVRATAFYDSVADVPLTQDELAGLAGTTRSTANRILQALATDGLIEVYRGGLRIIDVAGLQRRAR